MLVIIVKMTYICNAFIHPELFEISPLIDLKPEQFSQSFLREQNGTKNAKRLIINRLAFDIV